MKTKEHIIQLADHFIRDHGFNAFSYKDISREIGIKTASIHYHFPSKADLGVAVIEYHHRRLTKLMVELENASPLDKIERFLQIYYDIKKEDKVCLVGSLASDLHTVEEPIRLALSEFSNALLSWVMDILMEGKQNNVFNIKIPIRTKALLITTNLTAIVQLSRITGTSDFEDVCKEILNDLTRK